LARSQVALNHAWVHSRADRLRATERAVLALGQPADCRRIRLSSVCDTPSTAAGYDSHAADAYVTVETRR
jgi:hypothetical protein